MSGIPHHVSYYRFSGLAKISLSLSREGQLLQSKCSNKQIFHVVAATILVSPPVVVLEIIGITSIMRCQAHVEETKNLHHPSWAMRRFFLLSQPVGCSESVQFIRKREVTYPASANRLRWRVFFAIQKQRLVRLNICNRRSLGQWQETENPYQFQTSRDSSVLIEWEATPSLRSCRQGR
jgi:hypothetical protein